MIILLIDAIQSNDITKKLLDKYPPWNDLTFKEFQTLYIAIITANHPEDKDYIEDMMTLFKHIKK